MESSENCFLCIPITPLAGETRFLSLILLVALASTLLRLIFKHSSTHIPVDSIVMEASLPFSTLATKYATVAASTVLLWDMTLTLDVEISTVWERKKSFASTIFFLNRYSAPFISSLDLAFQFLVSPSIKTCKNYQVATTILDLVSVALIECVLIMRMHALYQNRTILICLALTCTGTFMVSVFIILMMVFRYETFVSASTMGLHGCLPGCSSSLCQPLFVSFWIPFMLSETTIFALTAWKSYQAYSAGRKITDRSSIVRIIIRDGLLYYVVIMSAAIANFLIWILYPLASNLAVGLLKSLQITICSRLFLNLRESAKVEETPSTFSKFEAQGAHLQINLDAEPGVGLYGVDTPTPRRRRNTGDFC